MAKRYPKKQPQPIPEPAPAKDKPPLKIKNPLPPDAVKRAREFMRDSREIEAQWRRITR